MTKSVILTGLRANNDLTLGNYFGGILPIVDMATAKSDEFQINMFIPDLHSFTSPIEHEHLYEQILHTARLFVAAGLPIHNDTIHLYRQSHVSAHSELTWILDCFTGFGEMSRMTQFKEKSSEPRRATADLTTIDTDQAKRELVRELFRDSSVGLFNYPVLMAADILLYDANYVPVGDDQTQHLEFTRNIAQRMNGRFGDLFVVPEAVSKQHTFFGKDQGLRVMDMQDPTKKMSKSAESDKGVIFLGDDPEVATKKVMSAATDDKAFIAYDKQAQPGISNLLEILSLLQKQPLDAVIMQYEGQTKYGEFKSVVADAVKSFLLDFQHRLSHVDDETVLAKLATSERAMNEQASSTLLRVQQAVGLRPKEL